jgi:hypothetical protein
MHTLTAYVLACVPCLLVATGCGNTCKCDGDECKDCTGTTPTSPGTQAHGDDAGDAASADALSDATTGDAPVDASSACVMNDGSWTCPGNGPSPQCSASSVPINTGDSCSYDGGCFYCSRESAGISCTCNPDGDGGRAWDCVGVGYACTP